MDEQPVEYVYVVGVQMVNERLYPGLISGWAVFKDGAVFDCTFDDEATAQAVCRVRNGTGTDADREIESAWSAKVGAEDDDETR